MIDFCVVTLNMVTLLNLFVGFEKFCLFSSVLILIFCLNNTITWVYNNTVRKIFPPFPICVSFFYFSCLIDHTMAFVHWRRKWQPTPVFLPGESQTETGEPGGLSSMGLHRVRHDWSDLAAAAAAWLSCSGE